VRTRLFVLTALAMVAGASLFFGCGGDDGAGPGPTPTPVDLDSAFRELAGLMKTMTDSMTMGEDPHLDDYDFSSLNQLFKNYEASHPGDPKASFGAAITSIMSLTASQELNALIDTLIVINEGGGLGAARVPNPGKLSSRWAMMAMPTELSGAGVERNFLAQSYAALMARAISNPPKFSEVQDIIREEFIPAIEGNEQYLLNVLNAPDFVFWLTPEMLGETSDSIEIDHTDFLVFASGLSLIASFFHMAIAYNVDLPSYDSAGIAYMFDQQNDWMSLYPDGFYQMGIALAGFETALQTADEAITSLQAEQATDLNQSNDLIKADWVPSDYVEAHAMIDSIQMYMTAPQWVYGDFDADPQTDSLRVDVSTIFTDPIDGFFSLFPPYTSEVITAYDTSWYWTSYWDGYEWHDTLLFNLASYPAVVITWDADTFEQWVFPNPSINGLLPDITTDAAFKQLFGLTPDMWQKQMQLDLRVFEL
jgi:hypothetical protein